MPVCLLSLMFLVPHTWNSSCSSNLNTMWSQGFLFLHCYGGRGFSFTGGEGRHLNLDVVDESKLHIASESETRQSHFFILKANSCSETSRLDHFLPAQKFSVCARTHLYTHMVRRTKKRSTKKNNSLMMSIATSAQLYVSWHMISSKNHVHESRPFSQTRRLMRDYIADKY